MTKAGFQNFLVRFSSNEKVFEEGDPGSTMFIVQSGKVRLYQTIDGQERDLGMMEKGDFFGEKAILEGLERTLSAEAVEDSELIEINSMTFDKMIKSNIEIAIRLLRKLSIRLREAERKVAELQGADPAHESHQVDGRRPVQKKAAAAADGTRLVAEDDGSIFALAEGETMIGRYDPVTELRPDIDLTAIDIKRSVSRQHARITLEDGAYILTEEIGALNGTFVNGKQLVAAQAQQIKDGDLIGLGMVKLRFHT